MVMQLNTGVPGSGKSYLMCKAILDLFYQYDKETGQWIFKTDKHGEPIPITLISNVEGLQLEHYDLETLMIDRCRQLAQVKYFDEKGDVDKKDMMALEEKQNLIDQFSMKFYSEKIRWFFSYEFQQWLNFQHKGRPIVYMIEESQRFFDGKELGRATWVRDVFYYFEKHRHLGHSIFMDTQHRSKIATGIACLFECEKQAKPRTMTAGFFQYNTIVDGTKVNVTPELVRPKKEVFAVYTSMNSAEAVKTKKPLVKVLAIVVGFTLLSVVVLKWAKGQLGPGTVQAAPPPGSEKSIHQESRLSGVSPGAARDLPAAQVPALEWVKVNYYIVDDCLYLADPFTGRFAAFHKFRYSVERRGYDIYAQVEKKKEPEEKKGHKLLADRS